MLTISSLIRSSGISRPACVVALSCGLTTLLATGACSPSDLSSVLRSETALYVGTDTMGLAPSDVRAITVHARRDLLENSAAVMSRAQPGIVFTINDSGNEPLLFALDTTGAERGAWRVTGTTNVDWEAAASGRCANGDRLVGDPSTDGTSANDPSTTGSAASASVDRQCLYIGDTGDNNAIRSERAIYRVREPRAEQAGFQGTLAAERLGYVYPDRPHDVEAMYVVADGTIMLITKRALRNSDGHLRPALIFALSPARWGSATNMIAELVDSLPIVPGSAPLRMITDASLSHDGTRLAVRTYAQIYVFATDTASGRPRADQRPAICNIALLETQGGEGIAWFAGSQQVLLTTEGRDEPMHVLSCPPTAGVER